MHGCSGWEIPKLRPEGGDPMLDTEQRKVMNVPLGKKYQ
jgi:hypothetical protein